MENIFYKAVRLTEPGVYTSFVFRNDPELNLVYKHIEGDTVEEALNSADIDPTAVWVIFHGHCSSVSKWD